jgi:hypothetical protein
VTILPTIVNADSNSSSSQVVVIPFQTYRGEYTSYFYEEDDVQTTLIVDVGIDRSFNLVKIDIISGISTNGYASNWTSQGPSIIQTYLSMNVDTLLAIDEQLIPDNLTITGTSVTTFRLLNALQHAFRNIMVFKGSAQSYACDECDTEDMVNATVYVDSRFDTILGIDWSGTITSGEPYFGIVQNQFEGIQDFYIGKGVLDILANGTMPIYPNFDPNDSGATISFIRLHQALLNALGD